ncbi:murein L,D-transpeptidase catalytic domain-containing protein [Mesorhizobium calcicola]|uniref:Murein L,D-transpeptidase catalytic domain-containing protein n=1 Tax=Mesorhizobium calcicola TaxID=1300310 RepID=A0ABW4WA72_9HYPH
MSGATSIDPATSGTHGFDASEKLTAGTAKALRQAGFRFAIRYLSRKSTPPDTDLTADELDVILDADLGLMAVQHVAKSGWDPSEELGIAYGRNAAAHAQSVGLPVGSSVWVDLEEVDNKAAADDVIAYCNAWFKEVEAAGYTSGVYVGSNCNLTGDQLYWQLKTKRYWKSGSNVPDIPQRGYCMVQHIIKNDAVGGVSICRDVTSVDAFGNAPMMAVRGAADLAMVAMAAPAAAAGLIDREEEEAVLRSLAAGNFLAEPMDALIKFRNKRGAPNSARYWAIANFNLRSSEPRLFVFDVRNETVQAYLCAHGKGSEGPTDDGYANVFSNVVGSNCTSLGVYSCAETYEGKHGYSMRLDGLEPTNSHARARAVVVHGADYVSPQFIQQTGRIGRSDGCLVVENRYVTEVVSALTGGSLVIAWHTGG